MLSVLVNLVVPYRSQLQEKFEPGQTLIVKGKSIPESKRFTISFNSKSADCNGNDIPFHISVRYDEGKIVMNSFSSGEWGKEEKKSNPLRKDEPFDIRVRAHENRFQIFVDHKEFKEYDYRLPLGSISHFFVDGDIFLDNIHWGGKYYPIPYKSGIAGAGFEVGQSLCIFGIPEKKGTRFDLNLLHKNGDIAFHFNPRFNEKVVVRNTFQNGSWEQEERQGKIPFERGVCFDLVIINEPTTFTVNVNDVNFIKFAHRSSPSDITGLQIQGDLEITGIQIR